MEKKFFVITGIVLTILLIANLILFGQHGLDLLFYLGLISAVIMLAYPKFADKLGEWPRRIVNALLLFPSFVTYTGALFLLNFIIANSPKAPAYESPIKPPEKVQAEQDAYDKLMALSDHIPAEVEAAHKTILDAVNAAPDGKFKFDPVDLTAEFAVVKPTHDEWLDFLSTQTISWFGPYAPEVNIPDFGFIHDIYKAELLEISNLLHQGEIDLAMQKYLRLWQATDRYIQGESKGLFDMMVGATLGNLLIKFHTDSFALLPDTHDAELIEIMLNYRDQFQQIHPIALRSEALLGQTIGERIMEVPEIIPAMSEGGRSDSGLGFFFVFPAGVHRIIHWPFHDANRDWERGDQVMLKIMELASQDYYKVESELDQIARESDDYYNSLSWFNNPLGIMLGYQTGFLAHAGFQRKAECRAKTLALKYLIQNKGQSELSDPPIDNLSGQPFTVDLADGRLTIQSPKDKEVRLVVDWE